MRRAIATALALVLTGSCYGALRVLESAPGPDFNVGAVGTTQNVLFTTTGTVAGIGFEARWIAVTADNGGGSAPWSIDLGVTVTPPAGPPTNWEPLGGEISIAEYPLADAAPLTNPGIASGGNYAFAFSSVGGPWVAGLRDVVYHALEAVPDVVDVRPGTTVGGEFWNRPFSIAGVSGLGPVRYHALEFTVSTPGLYVLESVLLDGQDHWASLYEGAFDPAQPLLNQLDYGLGNGFAANGSPRGTALIESLLLEGRTYTLVTSQWASFRTPGPYELTITGPGAIVEAGPCPTDFDADGVTGASDLAVLLAAWGQPSAADLDASGSVGAGDLAILLAAWGPCS